MQPVIFNRENIGSVDWEDQYFKYSEFVDFAFDGGHITSDFANCSFTNVDWYWGIFNNVNFVDCKFINCVFQGTSFADCKFVSCEFSDCKFIKDNLNGECDFDGSVAFDCKFINTEGFEAVRKLLLERLESKNVKNWDVEELRTELMRRKKKK